MLEKNPVSVPASNPIPRWAKYVFAGGVAGLVVGEGALFVVAMLYGNAVGLTPGSCTTLSCILTLLLSQPAGIAGMAAGGTVGAAAGGVVHFVDRLRTR